MKNYCIGLMLLPLLVGCAGKSQEDVVVLKCSDFNWYDLGAQTASKGHSIRENDEEIKKICKGESQEAALNQYVEGYTSGILRFCSEEQGYSDGKANKVRSDNCPAEVEHVYVSGNSVGLKNYSLTQQKVKDLKSEHYRMQDFQDAMEISKEHVKSRSNQ